MREVWVAKYLPWLSGPKAPPNGRFGRTQAVRVIEFDPMVTKTYDGQNLATLSTTSLYPALAAQIPIVPPPVRFRHSTSEIYKMFANRTFAAILTNMNSKP